MADTNAITPASKDRLGSDARTHAALHAAYEVEMIANTLLRIANDDATGDHFLTRSFGHRLKDLAGVAMSALADDGEEVSSILYRLTGVSQEEAK